jgi:hypothetical protein
VPGACGGARACKDQRFESQSARQIVLDEVLIFWPRCSPTPKGVLQKPYAAEKLRRGLQGCIRRVLGVDGILSGSSDRHALS